jgi:NAD(P)-dependent dehydrogenase (short-subunit alcohol dehydrogenase family)
VLGEVEILINDAAVVAPLGPTQTVQPEDVLESLLLNVAAPIQLAAAVVPSMLENRWGRIVNVSSAIAAKPEAMIGGNIYAATKTALEAHTLNLAAELAGTGIAVNVFRPGSVDTAMQAWIRGQQPDRIGAALHGRFVHAYERGELITPEESADELIALLPDSTSGQVWDVSQIRACRAQAS